MTMGTACEIVMNEPSEDLSWDARSALSYHTKSTIWVYQLCHGGLLALELDLIKYGGGKNGLIMVVVIPVCVLGKSPGRFWLLSTCIVSVAGPDVEAATGYHYVYWPDSGQGRGQKEIILWPKYEWDLFRNSYSDHSL